MHGDHACNAHNKAPNSGACDGLVAYLSGDTGITADQELVVRGHYNARLAVMSIGDGFSTGPVEAAYVIKDLVKPASVIASHANEVGTVGGKFRPGSKTKPS